MKKHFILIYLCILLFCGCTKNWLDKKTSQDLAVPTTLNDLQLLMRNSLQFVTQRGYIPFIAGDGYYFQSVIFQGTTAGQTINIYTWSHDYPYEKVIDWNGAYASIVYCNVVLKGLNSISPVTDAEQQQWNRIKGEALFYRALGYFELSQVFCPAYNSASANSDLGLPIRLNSDVNEPSIRSSVQATYDRILSDLTEAADLLPENALSKALPSSTAAHALLARIYLSIENYAKAEQHADIVLSLQSELLNFNGDPEIANSGTYRITQLNKEVIFHMTASASNFGIVIDTALYNLYSIADRRKDRFFRVNTDGTITYIGSYNKNASLFGGLTTSEMFLIRAECAARSGDKDAAISDLHSLLSKRYTLADYVQPTATDAEDALNQVLTERKKELVMRGQRWSDLRRLNRDTRFAVTITRTVFGQNNTITPGSYRYTYPVPDDVIAFSGIQQNAGW